jgi:aryl-alcohol dehydrogenase-like predicted oxidoreductase
LRARPAVRTFPPMDDGFLKGTLGRTGREVFRLGLSGTYRPGRDTILHALDEGINLVFMFGIDTQMIGTIRDLPPSRKQQLVVCTGAYNMILWAQDIRGTVEKRLRELKTDCIDVFLFLGVTKPAHMPPRIFDDLRRVREEGKVKAFGLSTHDRTFAGRLAAEGAVDVLMIRYNAAHRGAEADIFPHLQAHDPGVISYTATRWRYLIKANKKWPKGERVPDAGMAYRFVLGNPNVDVALTAPSNRQQFDDNLRAVRQGPLAPEEMEFMRRFGDVVHHTKKWFM